MASRSGHTAIVNGRHRRSKSTDWTTARIAAAASVVAMLMSTQFLAQPYVWRNWPADEVLKAWLMIAGDRLVVAGAITASLLAARQIPAGGAAIQAALLGGAIILGSVLGEGVRLAIDPFGDHGDFGSIVGRILQWSLVSAAFGSMFVLWRFQADVAAAGERAQLARARARQARTNAELEALQWQIEPHFLFNTLATIQSLGRSAPTEGKHLLGRLFDFIAANLTSADGGRSTLGTELDLCRAYLDVCGARMGGRLQVVWDIDDALRALPFPTYLLGTLVENAIKHGISPKPDGGVITLSTVAAGETLTVTVSDTGVGFNEQGGSGTGLANLKARLELFYEGRASLAFGRGRNGGVSAALTLPLGLEPAHE